MFSACAWLLAYSVGVPLSIHSSLITSFRRFILDPLPTQQVQVDGNEVDMVDSFTSLGSLVDRNGRSKAELVRWIAIAPNCMTSLDRNIWRSSISVSTKILLYSEYVLPSYSVLLTLFSRLAWMRNLS